MPDESTVRVPLRARDGSVRAYALIDGADAAWVNQWRWCLTRGYAIRRERRENNRTVYLHRELLGLPRVGDGRQGDHIDRDRMDNRRANLRVVTSGENRQNVSSKPGSSSRYRGVYFDKRRTKWCARIVINRAHKHLGYFDIEDEAGAAALAARRRLLPYAVD